MHYSSLVEILVDGCFSAIIRVTAERDVDKSVVDGSPVHDVALVSVQAVGDDMLERICNDAKTNLTLNLSRIKNKLDTMRNIGNYASHRITYNTTKKDIDDIKTDLRVLLEELLYKAGFII